MQGSVCSFQYAVFSCEFVGFSLEFAVWSFQLVVSGCGVIEEGTARIEGSENGSNVRLRERQRGFDDCVATDFLAALKGSQWDFYEGETAGKN